MSDPTTPYRTIMVACMGGWCRQRERCAYYHATCRTITERLCAPGNEQPEPIDLMRSDLSYPQPYAGAVR